MAADPRRTVRFDRFMAQALYGPDGFYARADRGAGRGGRDFLTSPEVGPLFGAVVARWLDSVWAGLDRPDPFVVHEWGSGPGTLRRAIDRAGPTCAPALEYAEVEHRVPAPTDPPHAVIANEMLDNLPVRVVRRTSGAWTELEVEAGGGPVWVPVDPPSDVPEILACLAAAPDGVPVPVQEAAARWVRDRLAALRPGGWLLVFDYGASTSELAGRDGGWLRTYRGQARGGPPWEAVGDQDITADVAVDQLLAVAPGAGVSTQAEWLRRHGIDELVEEGRRAWREGAGAPDLVAIAGRSRVTEAEALTDPEGLGDFVVMQWQRGGQG